MTVEASLLLVLHPAELPSSAAGAILLYLLSSHEQFLAGSSAADAVQYLKAWVGACSTVNGAVPALIPPVRAEPFNVS